MIMEYIISSYYICICLFADWINKALKKLMMLIKLNVQFIVHTYLYILFYI